MKRILILSDLHCGHRYGLAHPEQCVNNVQRKAWAFVEKGLKKYAPFDVVFVNGDAIDGNATRNGGVELITTDRNEQCDMAIKILRKVAFIGGNAPKYYFTRGTPYHTGNEENFEDQIAKAFQEENKTNIGETLLVNVEGITFDLKHKVGGGSMPHSKATPLMKDVFMGILKEKLDDRPEVDVFIRSHVHNYVFVKAMRRIAAITPALEVNSAYGQRQCSGLTDFGFLVCEVENGEILRWIEWINQTPILQEEVLKV